MKTRKYLIGLFLIIAASTAFLITAVNVQNKRTHNRSALFNAAVIDDLKEVKMLIQQGASINQKVASVFGFTPLIGAIYHDSTNITYYLIDAGADVNLADDNNVTPLMWATSSGDEAVPLVRYLIAHGARLDVKDKYGITVFGYAQSEPPKPELIKVLEAARLTQENRGASNSPTGASNTQQKL